MTSKSSNSLADYMCIDYPAFVKNDSEALKTLGGMDRIEQVFQHRNGKLLLNFNPDNIFSKALCSTSVDTTRFNDNLSTSHHADDTSFENFVDPESKNVVSSNLTNKNELNSTMPCLLMSVKKSSSKSGCEKPFEVNIIGSVKRFYNFQKIADFQYLPMTSHLKTEQANNESNKKIKNDTIVYNAFYDSFKFDNIDNCELDLRKKLLPEYFLLPPYFSRFDDPVNYGFRPEASATVQAKPKEKKQTDDEGVSDNDEATSKKSKSKSSPSKKDSDHNVSQSSTTDLDSSLIRSVRQERSSQAILITFKSEVVVPNCRSEKLKDPRGDQSRKCVEDLKELFKKRPCYLKNVLLCITNYSQTMLKECLPHVAYYFTTGPWRSCWVRYGYDPRLDPEAKIYQMIDYRLRNAAEPNQKIKAKPRSSYHKRKFLNDLSDSDSEDYKNQKFDKDMYKFKPDRLPNSRNVFYQLCDIEDEDVKSLIASSYQRPKCDEKDGWCIQNFQDKCRTIMSQKHEILAKIKNKITQEHS